MSFSKAGFKGSLTGIGSGSGGSSGGGGSGTTGLKVNQVPTTSDYITWQLPTTIPVVEGSLTLSINGIGQSTAYFELLPDNKSFVWLSADPIFPDDDVLTTFTI